jgi:toxin CcdB
MAQFDVYENPSVAQRGGFPYLVVLQSDLLNDLTTRLVMPLCRFSGPASVLPRRLTASLDVQGDTYYLAAYQCAALPAKVLKTAVTNVASQADVLRDALDAVLSGV